MSAPVLLVRHPPVVRAWSGRCYGSSDIGWSRAGGVVARALVARLSAEPAAVVIHSGRRRTARLAAMLCARTGAVAIRDERWRERDFGAWEGRSWTAIWRETGSLMDRMLSDPDDFRPGGGETTAELLTRVGAAWRDLPHDRAVIVIAHGGSIAAARAHESGAGVADLPRLIPEVGAVVRVERPIRNRA